MHVADRGHAHGFPDYNRAFALGVALNLAFTGVEFAFGLIAHSLALVSDAGHNLSDVLGLLVAWGASRLASQPPTARRTYGFRRSTILAALGNSIVLLIVVGGIVWEAIRRFQTPQPVASGTVIVVAAVGVVVNGASALLFLAGRRHDLNVRGAFQHLAADAGVSLGVVLAGIAMTSTGQGWIDPAVGLTVAVVIALGTWGLFRESLDMALDAVPVGITPEEVSRFLRGLPGVTSVHDLHIWAMSTSETALTAHLVVPDRVIADEELGKICEELHARFGIEHSTIQIENGRGEQACHRASGRV